MRVGTRRLSWIVAAFLAVQVSIIWFAANGPFVDEGLYTVAGMRVLEGKGLSDGYITWVNGSPFVSWEAARRSAHGRHPVHSNAGCLCQDGPEPVRSICVGMVRAGLRRQWSVHGPRPLCGLGRRRAGRGGRVDVVR